MYSINNQIITCAFAFTSAKANFARLQVSSNINTIPSSSATSSFENGNLTIKSDPKESQGEN
mgnify:CR=1 FL=1